MIRDVLGAMPQAYLVSRDEPDRIGDLIASRPPAPRDRPAEPNSVVVSYSRREIARRFAMVLDAASKRRTATAGPARGELVGV